MIAWSGAAGAGIGRMLGYWDGTKGAGEMAEAGAC